MMDERRVLKQAEGRQVQMMDESVGRDTEGTLTFQRRCGADVVAVVEAIEQTLMQVHTCRCSHACSRGCHHLLKVLTLACAEVEAGIQSDMQRFARPSVSHRCGSGMQRFATMGLAIRLADAGRQLPRYGLCKRAWASRFHPRDVTGMMQGAVLALRASVSHASQRCA